MKNIGDVLIAGAGPTSIQTAVLLGRAGMNIGICSRKSTRSEKLFAALDAVPSVEVTVQNSEHARVAGHQIIQDVFREYGNIEGLWEVLVMTVPADAYLSVLDQMKISILRDVKCIVLTSPTLGSAALVQKFLARLGCHPEIISFSSYMGDTRYPKGVPENGVLTAGVKKKVYAASSAYLSPTMKMLARIYKSAGIQVDVVPRPVDAEIRNISLYVHPALFMNDISLDAVFNRSTPPKYVYKLFPEGPITTGLVRAMIAQWREMSSLSDALGCARLNLLKFMIEDSYPVRPESIERDCIEDFEKLSPIHQEYLVYVRYASLLIDPFSIPDEQGNYFDFSAIPFRPVNKDELGRWHIPRMPAEDYYRTKMIQGMAERLGVPTPQIDLFIEKFDEHLESFVGTHGKEAVYNDPRERDFEGELDMIYGNIQQGLVR